MKCQKIQEHIYLHGGEREELSKAVLKHLVSCDSCSALLKSVQQVDAALVKEGEVPLPDDAYFAALPGQILSKVTAQAQPASVSRSVPWQRYIWPLHVRPKIVKPAFAFFMLSALSIALFQALSYFQHIEPDATHAFDVSGTDDEAISDMDVAEEIVPKDTIIVRTKGDGTIIRRLTAATQPPAKTQSENMPVLKSASSKVPLGKRKNKSELLAVADASPALQEFIPPGTERTAASIPAGRRKKDQKLVSHAASAARISSSLDKSAPDQFNTVLKLAQLQSGMKKKAKLWQDFIKTDPPRKQKEFAVNYLAEALCAIADASTDVLEIANCAAGITENRAILIAFWGEEKYERRYKKLNDQLNRARRAPADSLDEK